MTAHLQYLLITVKVVALEKVTFSDTQISKHYVLNRANLTQPIQIQLSQKQKNFASIFFCILKIYIKF